MGKITFEEGKEKVPFLIAFSIKVNKSHRWLLVGILLIFVSTSPIFSEGLSKLRLSDATRIALMNNKEIMVLQKEIEKSEVELRVASRIIQKNPEIEGAIKARKGSSGQNSLDFELSMSLPLEIKGQRKYRNKIARANLSIAKLQLEKKKLEVALKIKKLFIDITALKEKLRALQDILRIERDLAGWLRVKSDHGEISPITLNTVNLEVSRRQEQILKIKEDVLQKRDELELVMNYTIPKSTVIIYKWPEIPSIRDLKELLDLAYRNNPDIKISSLIAKIGTDRLNLVKAEAFLPTIAPSLIFSREDRDYLMGIGLSLPLPIFNRKSEEIKAANFEREKNLLETKINRERIRSNLKKWYETLGVIDQRKKLYREGILQGVQKNLDEVKSLYERGEIDFGTLERYWDEWAEAKIEYVNVIEDYYHVLCQIELLLGKEIEPKQKMEKE